MNISQATEDMIKLQRQVVIPCVSVFVSHLVSHPIHCPIHPILSFSAERKNDAPGEPGTHPSAPPPNRRSSRDALPLQDAELRDLKPKLESKTVHPSTSCGRHIPTENEAFFVYFRVIAIAAGGLGGTSHETTERRQLAA
jgi:hypothetical protein